MFYCNYPVDQKPMKTKEYISRGAFLNTIWRIFSVKGGWGFPQIYKKFFAKTIFYKGGGGGGLFPKFRPKRGMLWSKTTTFSPV